MTLLLFQLPSQHIDDRSSFRYSDIQPTTVRRVVIDGIIIEGPEA